MQAWDIGELVYRVSMLLLYPTLVLLGLVFLRAIWHLGESAQDAWGLRAYRKPEAARELRDAAIDDRDSVESYLLDLAASCRQHPQLRRFATLLLAEARRMPRETLCARIDHLIGRVESALVQDVNRVRVSVRLGPLLGLVGTLIPLGPGLMALNEGDIGRLSSQLVVAFSTTVVGLLVGGISYALALVRAHTADLVSGDIELVSDLVRTPLLPRCREESRGGNRGREGEGLSA